MLTLIFIVLYILNLSTTRIITDRNDDHKYGNINLILRQIITNVGGFFPVFVAVRQEKADLAQMSRPSPTS